MMVVAAIQDFQVLVLSAIDLSGRPYLNFGATFTCDKLGELLGHQTILPPSLQG